MWYAMGMRVIFMGTPDFAVPSLEAIIKSEHEVVAVVTQPDKQVGRGGKVESPPVKIMAEKHGIPVLQPENVSIEAESLKPFNADVIVTAAYGQFLRTNVLELCKHGVINVHASLLPKYRGAAPIQWAILNGDEVTGVTIMQTELKMDTGPIILQSELEIGKDETAGELFNRLSDLGAASIVEVLDLIECGNATFTPQDDSLATSTKKITKEFGLLETTRSPQELHNFIRALHPWPVAYFEWRGEIIRVHKSSIVDGKLVIELLQAPGGKVVSLKDFLNGRRISREDLPL